MIMAFVEMQKSVIFSFVIRTGEYARWNTLRGLWAGWSRYSKSHEIYMDASFRNSSGLRNDLLLLVLQLSIAILYSYNNNRRALITVEILFVIIVLKRF